MRKGVDSTTKSMQEDTDKEAVSDTPSLRIKLAKGVKKDRCKTPDSPEGARQAATPHSPPLSSTASPSANNVDSLTPPPSLPSIATALSLTLETSRSLSDLHAVGCPSNNGRPLSKVKKFLSTLVQFGNDINNDVGERVKSLILNLVSSNLTIEEFHHSLQDVTNFPLRPFVLPFLRTHMPFLQREIYTLARLNKHSTSLQYIRSHDYIIFEPQIHSPSEASEIFMSSNDNGLVSGGTKRRSPEGINYENGQSDIDLSSPLIKRPASTSFLFNHQQSFYLPSNSSSLANNNNHNLFDYQHMMNNSNHNNNNNTGIKTELNSTQTNNYNNLSSGDEEWRNIHVMLNCMLSMVEKTKRALTILQQRNLISQYPQHDLPAPSSDYLRKQDINQELKKVADEIISTSIRAAEERVAEVRRRAEEAVSDVKRQALLEMQRAVAAAEARSSELLAVERARIEKALSDLKKNQDNDQ